MKTALLLVFAMTLGVSNAIWCYKCDSEGSDEDTAACHALDSKEAEWTDDKWKQECPKRCAVYYKEDYAKVVRGCGCVEDADCWTCDKDFCTPDKDHEKDDMDKDHMGDKHDDDWAYGTAMAVTTSVALISIASIWSLVM